MNIRFSSALIFSFIIAGCGDGGGNSSSTDITPGNNNTTMGGCFTSFTTVGDPNTTISGKIQYEDKEYGIGGFTGKTSYKALRYAEVDIVNSGNSNVIDSVFTNSSGIYHIPPTTFTNGTSVYLRVKSFTTSNPSAKPDIVIGNMAGTPYAIACDSNFKPQTGASVTANLNIPASSPAAGAFNIMDVMTSGGEFLMSLGVTSPNIGTLNAFWQKGNLVGTYYCKGPNCSKGDGIYILSETGSYGDTDEFDDDVLWHEYGHFAADKFSQDDSQGGYHYIGQDTLDLRLAWSEGWGEFFQSAVKNWLSENEPSLLSIPGTANISKYVDTPNGLFFDLAAPGDHLYSSNEVSVASVLWKTMTNISNGMMRIWDIFDNFIPTASSPINLEVFWDGWISHYPAINLTSYFNDRQIYYQQDLCESDDSYGSARSIGSCGENVRYLYGSSDVDYLSFNATGGTSYRIETYDLKNGADTFITLYDTTGTTQISSNNNWNNAPYSSSCSTDCPANDGTNLSSKIITQPLSPGTYYVKVNASASRLPSAGRYGTYSLRITPTP